MINAAKLYDPVAWTDIDDIHTTFARLRSEDPVHLCQTDNFVDMWHITKHADIFEIEKRTDVFLNEPRIVVMPLDRENAVREQNGGSLVSIKSLVAMDAPEHQKMRVLTQAWFMPKNLQNVQDSIDSSIERAFDVLHKKNGECDFAKDVGVEYPLRVIMSVLGVSEEHYPKMLMLTQELFGPDDPDFQRPDRQDTQTNQETVNEFAAFFSKLTEEKKAHPTDDIASIIANAEVDGEPLGFFEQLGYYVIVATAGHDTTSYTLNEAIHQIAKDPNLLERLKSDPETMADKITEEAIRYASSVRHFVRTANSDFTLRGRTIRAGDSVVLWYPSGSRDEDIFPEPNTFNPDRDQSTRHTAFGHAAHMCLGMHLARQEISSFLKQFAQKVESIELAGTPKYTQAQFVSGIKSLPVKMTLSVS